MDSQPLLIIYKLKSSGVTRHFNLGMAVRAKNLNWKSNVWIILICIFFFVLFRPAAGDVHSHKVNFVPQNGLEMGGLKGVRFNRFGFYTNFFWVPATIPPLTKKGKILFMVALFSFKAGKKNEGSVWNAHPQRSN